MAPPPLPLDGGEGTPVRRRARISQPADTPVRRARKAPASKAAPPPPPPETQARSAPLSAERRAQLLALAEWRSSAPRLKQKRRGAPERQAPRRAASAPAPAPQALPSTPPAAGPRAGGASAAHDLPGAHGEVRAARLGVRTGAPPAPRRMELSEITQAPRLRRHFWLRERPFHSTWRCWAIGLLSLAAIALLVLYLTVPEPARSCGRHCHPSSALTLLYGGITAATILITLYFLALYAIGLVRSRAAAPRPAGKTTPLYVLVTPAHNEALVIAETVRCMLRLRGRFLVMVVNDGSSDGTGDIARAAGEGDERLIVMDRSPEEAGQGKGEVLNAAYREICRLVAERDPRMQGTGDEDVILCIVDADGWLRSDALQAVAPYFDDAGVAAVQVPVRMYNARRGFLACMQDIEFIGFSVLIQGGRDRIGSALLGGNGQFVRLSALRTLGHAPWTRALTEDLDIGLRLARGGWRNRVCTETCVAQQAVTRPRALLRQRTRWVQGHYSCWSHLPALWRTAGIRLATRIDLSLHLLLAATILIVSLQALLGVAGFIGVLPLGQIPLAALLGNDTLYRGCVLAAAVGPLGMLGVAYQRAAIDYQASLRRRLPWWSLPGVFLLFTLYVYFWGLPSTFRAFARLILRRGAWAKTAREPLSVAERVTYGQQAAPA